MAGILALCCFTAIFIGVTGLLYVIALIRGIKILIDDFDE